MAAAVDEFNSFVVIDVYIDVAVSLAIAISHHHCKRSSAAGAMILFARELDRANDKRGRVGNYTLKPKQSATNHQSAKSAIDRDTRRRRKKNVELHVAGSELMNYGLPFDC